MVDGEAGISPEHEAVLQSAAEAVATARAAVAASERQRVALEERLAKLSVRADAAQSAPVGSPESPQPAVSQDDALREVSAFLARERREARLAELERLGIDAPLSPAQLLAIAPDVDPTEPEGAAAFQAWKAANRHLFKRAMPPPDPVMKALRADVTEKAKRAGGLYNADAMLRNVFKQEQPSSPQDHELDALRTKVLEAGKRGRGLFDGEKLVDSMLGKGGR